MAINIKQFSGIALPQGQTVYTVPANTSAKVILNYLASAAASGSSGVGSASVAGRPWINVLSPSSDPSVPSTLFYGLPGRATSSATTSAVQPGANQAIAFTNDGTPYVIQTVVYMGPGESIQMSYFTYNFQVIEQL